MNYTVRRPGVYWHEAFFMQPLGVDSFFLSPSYMTKASDVGSSIYSAASIGINQNFVSQIDRNGDIDWIRVQLQAGQKYQISLNGVDTGQGTLTDPLIKGIYDSSGRSLGSLGVDDDSGDGRNAFINFEAPSAGHYYIAAAAYGRAKGTYTLRVDQDTNAPTVVSMSPVDDAVDVGLSANLRLTFSEPIWAGNGYLRLIGDDQSELSINALDGAQIQIVGNTVLLNPSDNLNPGVTYSLVIDAGALRDSAGNSFAGLRDSEYTFTTREISEPNFPAVVKWNIMVYVAGDNNLESYAVQDINEMESVAFYEDLAVMALMDRAEGYSDADGDWSDTRVARILPDATNSMLSFSSAESWGEMDTGNSQTLTDFILWSVENQPAENYALVIWDHGGGIDGIAWDDATSTHLSIADVSSAISTAISFSDEDSLDKFELITMDACLMAMAEVAYPLTPYTNYFVASEELVPGTGLAYDAWLDIFSTQSGDVTTLSLVNQVLTSYASEYQGERGITLSAFDMSLMNPFVNAMNDFTEIAVTASARDLQSITKTIARAVDFPADQSYDYADLAHAMNLISSNRNISGQTLKNAALEVSQAIDDLIIAEVGSVNLAQGLSIYLPYGYEQVDSNYSAENFSFLQAVPLWDDFLRII